MIYLDPVTELIGKSSDNPTPVVHLIERNRLRQFLTNLGYRTVAFETGHGPTEIQSSDLYLTPGGTLTQFQNELINLTPFRIWLIDYQNDAHRRRIRYIFDQLPILSETDSPTFVFAHVTSSHPPFVFGADGEDIRLDVEFSLDDGNQLNEIVGREEYIRRYKAQLNYLNKLLKIAIDKILSEAHRPLIIVIQGDHGPGAILKSNNLESTNILERMSILNAYYFYGQDYSKLYPDITPVNTFRVILNQYFGTNLGLLEDKSFFSLMSSLYDFIDVTQELKSSD